MDAMTKNVELSQLADAIDVTGAAVTFDRDIIAPNLADLGASVTVSETPPVEPNQGDMWWDSSEGQLYVWYIDVDSSQWVLAVPQTDWTNIGLLDPAAALDDANLLAVRQGANARKVTLGELTDHLAAAGMLFPGWNYSWSGGTADQPTVSYMTKGTQIIRATNAWSVGGDLDSAVWAQSLNAGVDYQALGTQTFTYDVDGNLTSITWS